MPPYLLAFDVGGTNSRAAATCVSDDDPGPHPDLREPVSRPVADRSGLEAFVGEIIERLPDDRSLAGVALAFAGPVRDGVARMTNWPEPREISLADLEDWGLPRQATALLNDVEAGAHGLMEILAAEGGAEGGTEGGTESLVPLRVPGRGTDPGTGNLVLVTPGTGLGCAGLVRLPGAGGRLPVASEAGHAAAAALDAEHATLIERLRDPASPGSPTWEDFISGRGLVTLYRHLPSGPVPGPGSLLDDDDPPGAIAEAALAGDDERAVRALGLYYRCVGRFAQLLALAWGAAGGVFLAGGSTRENRRFIEDSRLVEEFLTNPTQRDLLEAIPLYLVLEELNLRGALAVARRLAGDGRPGRTGHSG